MIIETENLKRNQDQTSDITISANQVSLNGITENKNANDHQEYRTKITPDGRIIRVILSEGETSSGVESVSSVDGADDFVAGNISVVTNNVFVEFKNEFAIEYSEGKMLKISKAVSLHEQNFFNGSEKNSDVRHTRYTQPSYDSYENNYGEKIDRSRYSSNRQQHNNEWSRRDELRDSSNRSDERESRRLNRSRSSRRRRSDKSRSSERHRSVSRNRRQSSQERRRLNNSRRSRRSRSSSRRRSRRSRSSSRRRFRRSRSSSRRRSRRSRSLDRRARRCGSLSRRSRSLDRRARRSVSLSRRSRSSSRRRSRRSRSLCRRSRSLSKISSGSFNTCPSHGTENIERVDSEPSSYSTTETRRERRIHHNRFSPIIRMPTPPPAYYPPSICPLPYWRPVNRIPHGYGRGLPYTIPRRPYPVPREVARHRSPLIPNRPDFEFSKSVPAKRNSEEDCLKNTSKNASNEDPKSEKLSEDNSRIPPLPKDSSVSDDNPSANATEEVKVCDLSEVHNNQCPFPKISLDNLPLVRGQNGWPVHISGTGETIPYDMSGKRIPMGPDGRYLPLDMGGRLYPHVMTPANEPLPIYLSEDGVLRLPDSRPVPFGPPNKYPVNIDGQFIPIGPDSRPLVPCPDVPTRPPIVVRKEPEVMESNEANEKDDTRSAYSKSTCSDSPNDSQSSPFETQPMENSVPDICIDYILEKIINSIDDESLRKDQELTNQQDKSTRKKFGEDPVVIKIRAALKTLYASNLRPPEPGRFILPEDMFEPPEKKWEMESPLLRHRIELPFLTPGSDEVIIESGKEQEKIIEYTFSSTGNFDVFKDTSEDEGEVEIIEERGNRGEKVKTAECGVQCDFTTDIINEYNTTLTKLRKEVISLQNAYSNLVDMYDKATAPKAF